RIVPLSGRPLSKAFAVVKRTPERFWKPSRMKSADSWRKRPLRVWRIQRHQAPPFIARNAGHRWLNGRASSVRFLRAPDTPPARAPAPWKTINPRTEPARNRYPAPTVSRPWCGAKAKKAGSGAAAISLAADKQLMTTTASPRWTYGILHNDTERELIFWDNPPHCRV